jgi:hypothetical protein
MSHTMTSQVFTLVFVLGVVVGMALRGCAL